MSQPRPVTVFPQSDRYQGSLKRPAPQDEDREQNKSRARFLQSQKPPRLPLPVNSGSLFVQDRSPQADVQPPPRDGPSPQDREFMNIIEEDQAGTCTVAYRGSNFQTFAVKTRMVEQHQLDCLKRTHHPNICNLADFFQPKPSSVCLVYEDMAVSLAELQSCPTATFKEYELAAIGSEVLQGLIYLEIELILGHDVTSDGVLLSSDGAVKIANVGDSMMRGLKPSQSNLKAVGAMLVELMEPATSLAAPGSIQLKTPERWGNDLNDFITLSATAMSKVLFQHDFLKKSPGPQCLIPHIRIGTRTARRRWKLVA